MTPATQQAIAEAERLQREFDALNKNYWRKVREDSAASVEATKKQLDEMIKAVTK